MIDKVYESLLQSYQLNIIYSLFCTLNPARNIKQNI